MSLEKDPKKCVLTDVIDAPNTCDEIFERRSSSEDRDLEQNDSLTYQLHSSLLNATTDAIVVYDTDGNVQYVNAAFTSIFGWTIQEILGKRIPYMPETETSATMEVIDRVVGAGQPCSDFETVRLTKDGRLLNMSISASCFRDKKGLTSGMIAILRDITDNKKAQKESRLISERLDLALRGADLGFWDWNIKTGSLTLSDRSTEILNYRLHEIPQNIEGWRRLIHPNELPDVMRSVNDHLNGLSAAFKNEYRMLSKGGSWIWILERGKVVEFDNRGNPLRAAGTVHDITDRKLSEDALKQSEKNYRAIFNAVEDAIFIHDISSGKILDVNDSFSRLYGYDRDEALNADFSMFTADDAGYAPSRALEKIRRAAEGQAQCFEWRARTKTGDPFWVEVSLRKVNLGGGPQVLALVRDISKRKEAEEILLHSELIKAVAELASGVAHNFNNLLQRILASGQSALIKLDQGDVPSACGLLNEIAHNAKNGSETVKRLQSFAQIRSDIAEESDKIFDLSRAVRDALDMSELLCRTLAAKNGIYIKTQTDLTEELMIPGRSNDLFEVALNLFRNAIEATPNGGLVTVRTYPQDGFAILEVQDTGTGIAPENLGRIFDPFFTTKGMRSTGMGLAAAYGIVTSHGGTVSVDTETDRGSKFTVSLPLASIKSDENTDDSSAHCLDSSLRLLIIDDDEILLSLFQDALTALGQHVRIASSGAEALQILDQESFDVITCDLGMPHMNGWEVGKRIKAILEDRGENRPSFILLTGWGGQTSEREKMIESGVDLVIEKPIDIVELIEKANDLVNKTPVQFEIGVLTN
jgi:two-component system cell cycle sensor histidine kinase/response regulator CckA